MQWLYEKHCLTSRICCKWMLAATQVDPKGWCALCRKDKPENAGRNDVATARHIGLLVCSALPEELNQMAAGGDVKATVMTILFLRACIANMIADQERKSISDGSKKKGGGENPYGPCKSRHLVWRHYGKHLPGGSHPDHLSWPTRNGRSALAPPLKSF